MSFPVIAGTLGNNRPFEMMAVDDLGAIAAVVFSQPDRSLVGSLTSRVIARALKRCVKCFTKSLAAFRPVTSSQISLHGCLIIISLNSSNGRLEVVFKSQKFSIVL